jgi:hypothetical protein
MNGVITLVLVVIGCALIILGAYMSLLDWKHKHRLEVETNAHGIDKTITALTALVKALEDYPTGQRMIVFGILILAIAGVFGGISGLQ